MGCDVSRRLRMLIRETLMQGVSDELEELVRGDQRLRNEWARYLTRAAGLPVPQSGYVEQATMVRAKEDLGDVGFAEVRNRFIEEHGTTPDDMFGDKQRHKQILTLPDRIRPAELTKEDWGNLWLLAQHMDAYPDFQKRMLEIIREHLGEGHDHYRFLADRISCRETGTQRWGTQDVGSGYKNCKWIPEK